MMRVPFFFGFGRQLLVFSDREDVRPIKALKGFELSFIYDQLRYHLIKGFNLHYLFSISDQI